MALEGKIGNLTVGQKPIITNHHPAVMASGLIAQNLGVWPGGTILARDGEGRLEPWDGTGRPAGVLGDNCDSTGQASAVYLAHGTAAIQALVKKDGLKPTADELNKLAEAGIFGV